MDTIKEKIVEKLEHLPAPELSQILDFVDFLAWRNKTRLERSDRDRLESNENCSVDYQSGVLVVKAARKTEEREGLENGVYELREERLRKLTF